MKNLLATINLLSSIYASASDLPTSIRCLSESQSGYSHFYVVAEKESVSDNYLMSAYWIQRVGLQGQERVPAFEDYPVQISRTEGVVQLSSDAITLSVDTNQPDFEISGHKTRYQSQYFENRGDAFRAMKMECKLD